MVNLKERAAEIDSLVVDRINKLRLELKAVQDQLQREQQVAQSASAAGDRSENAEWQIATDNIARCVSSIATLSATISTYERSQSAYTPTGKITEGSVVRLQELGTSSELIIKLYPAGLGSASIGAIAVTAPLGQALLGECAGSTVYVRAPLGDIPYCIKEVL